MNGPLFWQKLGDDLRARFPRRDIDIAGGCVRDWLLGIHPRDIDIFVSHSRDDVWDTPDGWQHTRNIVGNEEYPGAGDRFNVTEFIVEDTTVQVMTLQNGFHTHYAGFDNNLTKGYYQHSNRFQTPRLHLDAPLLQGTERQQIWGLGQNANQDRLNDQLERLNAVEPGWTIVEDPARIIVNDLRRPQGQVRPVVNEFDELLGGVEDNQV